MSKTDNESSNRNESEQGPVGGLLDDVAAMSGAKLLQICGMIVFVVAGLTACVHLMVVDYDAAAWERFRTLELFAMIGAIGVVVAIVSGSANAFVLTFGIAIIGALIVPTKDMVALALLVTNSDRSANDFITRESDGVEFRGRDTDLANKIIENLQSASLATGTPFGSGSVQTAGFLPVNLDPSSRKTAEQVIVSAIQQERVKTALERVRFRGATNMLLALRNEEFESYLYRFGNEAEFVEDLQTLRRQGLVSFSYSDISGAEIEPLGASVACLHEGSNLEACEPSHIVPAGAGGAAFPDASTALFALPSSVLGEVDSVLEACANDPGQFIGVDFDGSAINGIGTFFRSFAIAPGTTNRLSIWLTAQEGTTSIDPYLVLLKQLGGTCEVVERNDDSPSGLDSLIEATVTEGNYLIVATNFSGDPVAPLTLRVAATALMDQLINQMSEQKAGEEPPLLAIPAVATDVVADGEAEEEPALQQSANPAPEPVSE